MGRTVKEPDNAAAQNPNIINEWCLSIIKPFDLVPLFLLNVNFCMYGVFVR